MAFVDRIYIHSLTNDIEDGNLTAYVKLKPAGEVTVKFKMPDGFHQCILDAAQAAADLHEQQMKAEILSEGQPKQETKNA